MIAPTAAAIATRMPVMMTHSIAEAPRSSDALRAARTGDAAPW